MNERQSHIKDSQKSSQTLLIAITVTAAAIAIGVFTFLRFYNAYIDKVLYQERLNQMREVTTQLFTGLEDVVNGQWQDVEAFCNYVETGTPENDETLLKFMQKQAAMHTMDTNGEKIVAVDNLGRYMTQDGWQGALEDMDYLLSQPERVSFVSKSMISDESRMYFLKRLPEPVELEEDGQKIQIIYFGISQDMSYLNPYFSCGAYDNSNSVYVLNESGMRIFSSNDHDLIKGYNAYTVLQKMEYLHNNSFEEAKADLDENGSGYSNAVMNGEEYYYALYRMSYSEWTLLFLVPSSYVATTVVSLVNTTVRMILIFAIILLVVTTAIIFVILQTQKKNAVAVERHNSERLAEALSAAERAERKATEASHAKTDFLSNMSHDIRTPMNAIVGITNLMAHDKDDPIKMETYIHKVQMSSQHLLSLINDVLDMSKIESSAVTLNIEPISLAEQVGQIESIIRPQAEDRKQQFEIRVHEINHEHLLGDAVRMRQILINLLSNALKYTQNGGEIVLELTELSSDNADYAKFKISVTDNGYGMSPEFVQHIFEPFTRAENSTTNRVQGTGLGMAITKNIVDLMNGTINVQSELGKGSRFEVVLPFEIDKNTVTELPFHTALLVTDDAEFIKNARAAFRTSDVNLLVAQSEPEVNEILQREAVEVVLLTGTLQGQTLADNVQRLRKKTGTAMLFYCCDYAGQAQLDAIADKGGVDAVLTRPLFLSNLANAIDRACNNIPVTSDDDSTIMRGMHFLCAEDNALNSEILEAVLDMNGASCVIYPNGKEIVDAFATVKPGEYDAILMDVQMPVMNGLDATRAIRRSENPLGKTIPIIAMTANAFSEDVQHCLDAGMDAHVSKPLDVAVLERTLRSVVTPPQKIK